MKNVFAVLAGFVLLAPAVLASPVAFPEGKGVNERRCIEIREKCEGGNCHEEPDCGISIHIPRGAGAGGGGVEGGVSAGDVDVHVGGHGGVN